MFLFRQPAEWAALGHALGLTPHTATAGYAQGASFRQLKRALGFPAPPSAPSFGHWLYGRRSGVEVLVLTYDVGSGSNRTTYTGALTRVDPPVFLGLSVRGQSFLDDVFGGPDIQIGHPFADGKLRVEGFDPARIAMLLSPHDPEGHALVSTMVGLREHDLLSVTDSVVALSEQGTLTDAARLAWMLDSGIHLAGALVARRRTLPPSPGELAQQASWRHFADAEDLAFDPARMTLSGTRGGVGFKIALETEGKEIRTAVDVRFPQPVHVAFTVRRTSTPSFLQGLFGQDIRVGDPAFDDRFVVTGQPEPLVRQALARPDLLRLLVNLAAACTEVQMTHAGLFFRVHGPSASADELARILATGRAASSSLFGEIKGVGPYR